MGPFHHGKGAAWILFGEQNGRGRRGLALTQFGCADATVLQLAESPIVDALTVRGFPRARVEALAAATKEVVEKLGAHQTKTASPHTELESQAVAAPCANLWILYPRVENPRQLR